MVLGFFCFLLPPEEQLPYSAWCSASPYISSGTGWPGTGISEIVSYTYLSCFKLGSLGHSDMETPSWQTLVTSAYGGSVSIIFERLGLLNF